MQELDCASRSGSWKTRKIGWNWRCTTASMPRLPRPAMLARQEVMEERQLKEAEKDKKISDLRLQIEEWKRKAEQGSQQLQGEV